MEDLLKVNNLSIDIKKCGKKIRVVENVSFSLSNGETMGIIGESGCGKSVTALSLLGLLEPNIVISEGKVMFGQVCLSELSRKELRRICGREIGMVFQEPMTALNPVFTIKKQLSDPLKIHMHLSKKEVEEKCIELLETVGIKKPSDILKCYPHQLSGGMRQRVIIAIAISCGPQLLIADEPTTALDVTIQLQILYIIKRLVEERKMSLLIISHDMGVIAMLSEKICVMYAGEVVEQDSKKEILSSAAHPYSQHLISAAKELNGDCDKLSIVEGTVPRPGDEIKGCRFAERCNFCQDICFEKKPPLVEKKNRTGYVRCWKYVKE